ADFLLFFGDYEGQKSGLLFVRETGSKQFSFREHFPAAWASQIVRPAFTALPPDGRVACLFTDPGGYAELATIQPGSLGFGSTTTNRALFYKHRLLNFGAAIDPQTGSVAVADQRGALSLLIPSGPELAARQEVTE